MLHSLQLKHLLGVAALFLTATADSTTAKHEAGRCAVRGQCEAGGFFGPGKPCADNGLAKTPSDELRQELVELCGSKWQGSDVCCDDDQVQALKSNPVQHVWTTFTTFSAPLPALPTRVSLSTSRARRRIARETIPSLSWTRYGARDIKVVSTTLVKMSNLVQLVAKP